MANRFAQWFPRLFGAVVTTTTSNPNQWFIDYVNGGEATDSGVVVNEQSAMRCSTVFACVSLIGQSIASLPFGVIRKEGKRRIPETENRAHLLIHESPNEFMTPVVFWDLLMCNLLLNGNGYARIERNRAMEPIALLPINPSRVTPERINGKVRYQVALASGEPETVESADMLHIPGLGFDGLMGMSVIRHAARQSIGLALAGEKHGSRMFANGTRLSGILKTKKTMTPEGKRKFLEGWSGLFSGTENAGKTPILEEDMDFVPTAMTAEDAQFLESRTFQVADISRFFRVPLHMINEASKSTSWGTGLEQQSTGFVQYTLRPWIVRIEQEVTRKILRGGSQLTRDLFAKFSLEGLLRGDSAARAAFYSSGINNAYLTPNDVRAYEDLEPKEGGDELYIQGAMVPLARLASQSSQPIEDRHEL